MTDFWRLYKKENNLSVNGISRVTCWVLPLWWGNVFGINKKGRALLEWMYTLSFCVKHTDTWSLYLVCFCFLFTIQDQFTLVNPRNVLPSHPQWRVLSYSKAAFEKVKMWEEGHKTQSNFVFCQEELRRLFNIFRRENWWIKDRASKITSPVFLFQGNITVEALFPLHARWCQQHFWGMWWLLSNNAVSQLPATGQ